MLNGISKNPIPNIILAIFLTILCHSAFAGLNVTDLKDLHPNINLLPEFNYLSPTQAFVLSKQGTLINGFNYPRNNSKGAIDPVDDLIQNTFNAANATDNPDFFQVSPLASKFGRFLAPETIGLILHHLTLASSKNANSADMKSRIKESILTDPHYQARVKEAKTAQHSAEQELEGCNSNAKKMERALQETKQQQGKARSKVNLINRGLPSQEGDCIPQGKSFKELQNELISMEELLGLEQASLPTTTQDSHQALKERFEKVGDHLGKSIEEATKDLANHRHSCTLLFNKVKTRTLRPEYIDQFLDRTMAAWTLEGTDQSHYPKHITEQILLTLAWMNAPDNGKRHFVDLYKAMPHVLSKPIPDHDWNSKFDHRSFDQIRARITALDEPARSRHLLDHPDEAALLTAGSPIFHPQAFTNIPYDEVRYHSPTAGNVEFADCMDSSQLSFLVNLAKNPTTGELDFNFFKNQVGHLGFQFHPELEKFMNNHSKMNSLLETRGHEAWAPLISDVPGIVYVQQGYEMETTVDNIFATMDHLLFRDGKEKKSLKEFASRRDKLDHLCQYLSWDKRKVSWKLLDHENQPLDPNDLNSLNTNVKLEFEINGRPAFRWKISEAHSEIKPIQNSQNELIPTGKIADGLASVVHKGSSINSAENGILNWFVSGTNLPAIGKRLGIQPGTHASLALRFSIPFQSIEEKIDTALEIASSNNLKLPETAKQLYSSLPAEDIHAQSMFFDGLIASGKLDSFSGELGKFYGSLRKPNGDKNDDPNQMTPRQTLLLQNALKKGQYHLLNHVLKSHNFTENSIYDAFRKLGPDLVSLCENYHSQPEYPELIKTILERSPKASLLTGGDRTVNCLSTLIARSATELTKTLIETLDPALLFKPIAKSGEKSLDLLGYAAMSSPDAVEMLLDRMTPEVRETYDPSKLVTLLLPALLDRLFQVHPDYKKRIAVIKRLAEEFPNLIEQARLVYTPERTQVSKRPIEILNEREKFIDSEALSELRKILTPTSEPGKRQMPKSNPKRNTPIPVH